MSWLRLQTQAISLQKKYVSRAYSHASQLSIDSSQTNALQQVHATVSRYRIQHFHSKDLLW